MIVLTTALAISGIATFLSVMIVIAQVTINRYGECTIDINDGHKKAVVQGGGSLLAALAENGIFVPSACGGKATCGLCKVSVIKGAGPLLPTEEPYLSGQERKKNIRLSCQVKVKNDLAIALPEEWFSIGSYEVELTDVRELTYDIKEFVFDLIEPEQIEFLAGQYMQLTSKPYGKVTEPAIRAYSMSSLPSKNRQISFIIRLVPGGVCTTYLFEHIEKGTRLTLTGPYGDFYIRKGDGPIVFIAGGSGLAPIKSMVFDLLEKKSTRNMTFFFGARTKKDLYYEDLFRDLEKKHSHFHYIPSLSAPSPDDDWSGERGLITKTVKKYVKDSHGKQAYLCGSPGMLKACAETLSDIGFSDEHIFFDSFG